MKFTPKTETEVSKIFENGIYEFVVESAQEKESKSGNNMIHLKIKILHDKYIGKTNFVDCYLLTENPNFEFILRHFCYSIGLGEAYEKGEITDRMCVDKSGLAKVVIEKDKDGQYPDKNKIVDFIVDKNRDVLKTKDDLNDDIPF